MGNRYVTSSTVSNPSLIYQTKQGLEITRLTQRLRNSWHTYHVTEAVQAIVGTHFYSECSSNWYAVHRFSLCIIWKPNKWTWHVVSLGKGVVEHGTVSRGLKKFRLGCKNLDNPARSARDKTVDSEGIVQL